MLQSSYRTIVLWWLIYILMVVNNNASCFIIPSRPNIYNINDNNSLDSSLLRNCNNRSLCLNHIDPSCSWMMKSSTVLFLGYLSPFHEKLLDAEVGTVGSSVVGLKDADGSMTYKSELLEKKKRKVMTKRKTKTSMAYPWKFSGRLWFRPALVRVPQKEEQEQQREGVGSTATSRASTRTALPPSSVSIVSLFGYTIGGVVALEYDTSPVGPYREYVTMGAIVSKRGAIGQWGSKLYVSTKEAEDVCQKIWGVPATFVRIEFNDNDDDDEKLNGVSLYVKDPPSGSLSERINKRGRKNWNDIMNQIMGGKRSNNTEGDDKKNTIRVNGWKRTRILSDTKERESSDTSDVSCKRYGNVPVLWTPTIKALWAPFVPFPPALRKNVDESPLALHQLRLSASAIRLRLCGQDGSDLLGIPLPVGLVLDNVLIEISPKVGQL